MPIIDFDALDYRADQTFATARYRFDGDTAHGWRVLRDGALVLELGAGYRPLRVRRCGVCSTDLSRHHLPFPLPQVIGHEVIAVDQAGQRYVVEINASHVARGVPSDCEFCRAGLDTHCPARVTLGIHDLPGGFGPWILAPVAACVEVPATVPDSAAVLVEPFAAALRAVHTIAPRDGDRIAVLGPRRLGMLVIAALAAVRAQRRRQRRDFAIAAVARDRVLLELARSFGATEAHSIGDGAPPLADAAFDVVVDTTGHPDGLATAVRLARREVHLKSTHGQASCGLRHLTELVVDELAIARFPKAAPAAGASVWEQARTGRRPRVAWLAAATPPEWLQATAEVARGDAVSLAQRYAAAHDGLPRADTVVADDVAQIDAAIRPRRGREEALVRPRGTVFVLEAAHVDGALLAAVVARDLRLTSSRCGDFRQALALLAADADLCHIGERLITDHFAASDLSRAFAVARSRSCIKAVVEHDAGDGR